MANHASLSRAQAEALSKFLEKHMPDSLDELAEAHGTEDAFRLTQLRERLKKAAKK